MENPKWNTEQIKIVSNFSELVKTPFQNKNNALCWKREIQGDFKEIVSKLSLYEDITEVTAEDLLELNLTFEGNLARNIILEDLRLLQEFGAQPSLNLLKCYERDDEFDFISTDVYSYHVDRSELLIDTYLCTYHGAASDIIANDEVIQKIKIPEVRTQLLALQDNPNEDFETFAKENFFDLHYQSDQDAQHINLGNGHIWRLAVDHPDQPVLPCVHRAPIENDGELRLMLIC